jgi:hypothetical protein
MMPTEQGSSLNLHLPKATTKANEEESEEGLQTGRFTRFATDSSKLRPGANERPGRTGNVMVTQQEEL